MRTSLKLCTMKSLPVLNKNSNTQGCRSLLEVGEDNAKPRTKKIMKVKIHQYSETKYGVFLACRAIIWPQFWSCFASLQDFGLLLSKFISLFAGLSPNAKFQPKARQSDFPEYTTLPSPKTIGSSASKMSRRQKKGHSRDSTMFFLSPQYLITWPYEGLMADS